MTMNANDDLKSGPRQLLERLLRAANEHDLEALVACFAADYRNETPVYPARGFVGRERVRRNWEQIFTFVPNVTARLLAYAVDGDTIWSEWEHSGTRADGSRHLMRGVMILGVTAGSADWVRFYLESVDDDSANADIAVARQVSVPGVP